MIEYHRDAAEKQTMNIIENKMFGSILQLSVVVFDKFRMSWIIGTKLYHINEKTDGWIRSRLEVHDDK